MSYNIVSESRLYDELFKITAQIFYIFAAVDDGKYS